MRYLFAVQSIDYQINIVFWRNSWFKSTDFFFVCRVHWMKFRLTQISIQLNYFLALKHLNRIYSKQMLNRDTKCLCMLWSLLSHASENLNTRENTNLTSRKKVLEVIKFITNLFSFDTSEKKRLNKRKKRKENIKFNEKNTWILSWRKRKANKLNCVN